MTKLSESLMADRTIKSGIDKNLYERIHYWLRKTFDKPTKCEGDKCNGRTTYLTYALVKGKKYEFKRENYIVLCKSCHTKYDSTERGREINRNILKNYGQYNKKEVAQFSLSGEFIKSWDSIVSASRSLGLNHNAITKCATGVSNNSGGFIWKKI